MNVKIAIATILLLFLLLGSGVALAQTSSSYSLDWHVISGGGQPAQNSDGTITMRGTVGQTAIGPASSTSYSLGSGYWYLIKSESSTAITLVSFTATPGDSGVTLAWETATETNNAGFNLHRSAGEAGPYTQINAALIPAKGTATGGAVYSYLDTAATDPDMIYYYKLEDIDTNAGSTFHGPVDTASEVDAGPNSGRIYLPIIAKE